MTFSLIHLDNVDNNTFAWPFMRQASLLPPVAVSLQGKIYRVSNFGSESAEYLFAEVSCPEEALEVSLSFYGDISLPELASLAALSYKLGVNAENLSVFRSRGIKGRKNIDTLIKTAALPINILSYIARKDIPLKTVALLASFSPKALRLVESRILLGREPSVGEFIKFINDAADFREFSENAEYFYGFKFPERTSPQKAELERTLKELNASLTPVSITVSDFFETGGVRFSFETFSDEDFIKASGKLSEKKHLVLQFFDKLKQYDIR